MKDYKPQAKAESLGEAIGTAVLMLLSILLILIVGGMV